MRVRMKTRYANGLRAIEPDQVADLPDDEAADLIAKGFAVAASADPKESATGTAAKMRAATPTGKDTGGQGGDKKPAAKKTAAKKAAPAAAGDGHNPPANDTGDGTGESAGDGAADGGQGAADEAGAGAQG